MVLFSQRIRIEEAFNEWARVNHVARLPSSVVGFLQIHGCLNEDVIRSKFPVEDEGSLLFSLEGKEGTTPLE